MPTPSFPAHPHLTVSGAILLSLTLSACGGGGGGDETAGNVGDPAAPNANTYALAGSVGDGPIVDSRVRVTDALGRTIAETTGSSKADYRLELPADAAFPLIVHSEGGTDLVTQREPDFVMQTVAFSATDGTANINPFSTLSLRIASLAAEGLNEQSLAQASASVRKYFGFTLDPEVVPDAIRTPMGEAQALNLIPASEALAETIRRVSTLSADPSVTPETVIEALAADLVDGSLDADAGGTEGRIAATAAVVAAEVMLETLADALMVDGAPALERLQLSLDSTADVKEPIQGARYWSAQVREQLQSQLKAAHTARPDPALASLHESVTGLPDAPAADAFADLLSAEAKLALQASTSAVQNGDSGLWTQVATAANAPADEAPCCASAPEPAPTPTPAPQQIRLSWDAGTGEVDGYLVFTGPDAQTVSDLVSDLGPHSAGFDPVAPALSLDPEADLGLRQAGGSSVCFSVKAYNAAGTSDPSTPACTTL